VCVCVYVHQCCMWASCPHCAYQLVDFIICSLFWGTISMFY